MSVIDKVLGKITPLVSEEKRREATQTARGLASPGDWLSAALDHHDEIRECFAEGRAARSAADRTAAMKRLSRVLNPHSLAEEVVLYPALAQCGEKLHAGHAYTEQTTAKMQMAELENIAPSSDAWKDKWEHIEGAVLTHIFEEESSWFIKLREKHEDQAKLTARFKEEFDTCHG